MAKSLKEQNRWQTWLFILINSILLYGITQTDAVKFADLCSIFTDISKLVPVALAVGIATVLNGLLDPNAAKARLVFLRWRSALPGHRAFSQYMQTDPASIQRKSKKRLDRLCQLNRHSKIVFGFDCIKPSKTTLRYCRCTVIFS